MPLTRNWGKTTVTLEPVGVAGLITAWNASVACDQASVLAHQRRRRPAPLLDARGYRGDLGIRVGPGIFRVRDQPIDRPPFDLVRRPRPLISGSLARVRAAARDGGSVRDRDQPIDRPPFDLVRRPRPLISGSLARVRAVARDRGSVGAATSLPRARPAR